MSKAATETVEIYCPHSGKVPHKKHSQLDPMVVCFGGFYILPKEFYCNAESMPPPNRYFEKLGTYFPMAFCDRCLEAINVPEIILQQVKKLSEQSTTELQNQANLYQHNGNIFDAELPKKDFHIQMHPPTCKKTVSCLNAARTNSEGIHYHKKDNRGITAPYIIRMECTIRPAEYTAYVSEQTWKFGIVMDACEFCVSNVFPEILTIIDRYKNLLIVNDTDFHDPDKMLSMHQVVQLSGGQSSYQAGAK